MTHDTCAKCRCILGRTIRVVGSGGAAVTVIDGLNKSGNVFQIEADNVVIRCGVLCHVSYVTSHL